MEAETLTLNDLKVMAQIIKVVSNRGAIQPEEMAVVGSLYSKLVTFIKAATPEEKSDEETKDLNSEVETQGN